MLQSVRVLAIDQSADERADKPAVVKAVTLEVDTTGAQKLALAASVGTLSLMLRKAGEAQAEFTRQITLTDLGNPSMPIAGEGRGRTVRDRRGDQENGSEGIPGADRGHRGARCSPQGEDGRCASSSKQLWGRWEHWGGGICERTGTTRGIEGPVDGGRKNQKRDRAAAKRCRPRHRLMIRALMAATVIAAAPMLYGSMDDAMAQRRASDQRSQAERVPASLRRQVRGCADRSQLRRHRGRRSRDRGRQSAHRSARCRFSAASPAPRASRSTPKARS